MLPFVLTLNLISAPLAFGAIDPEDRENAKAVVETIVARAKTLDKKATHAESAKTIESLVDFQKLTTEALGDRAQTTSSAQKKEIQDLLKKILTQTIYPEAPKFFQNVTIEYTDEQGTSNSGAHLKSVITKGTRRSVVEYWLEKTDNKYRVVDLAIEGERWVENVRNQFEEIIQKQGTSGLIARMKKRLSQLKSQNNKG